MSVQSSKTKKAIFGWEAMMVFGVTMAVLSPISQKSLSAISMKIKREISGQVQKLLRIGRFYVIMRSLC